MWVVLKINRFYVFKTLSKLTYEMINTAKKGDSIGPILDYLGSGFFIDSSFLLDSETLLLYGFSDIKIWNQLRESDKKTRSHKYNLVPIEE